MDGSRVAQTIDSLWFYTNIFASTDHPLAPLIDQFAPSIHFKQSPERDFQKPFTPFLVNQQDEPRNVETLTPKFGSEVVVAPAVRERNKTERRKRRKWNNVVDERVDLWFDKLEEESCKHHGILDIKQQTKMMPPLDDAVAMKKHLKSWACAVAVSALSDEIFF